VGSREKSAIESDEIRHTMAGIRTHDRKFYPKLTLTKSQRTLFLDMVNGTQMSIKVLPK
jgi:hypothetical protein